MPLIVNGHVFNHERGCKFCGKPVFENIGGQLVLSNGGMNADGTIYHAACKRLIDSIKE